MYEIYADDVLIYSSTHDREDRRINKGSITLEVNKSGSFTFAIYPDHFYYEQFVRLKTVITVYKSGRIVFRGRVLNDTTDYWNNKTLTCEGELGFLQDTIIRPFSFTGTPAALFAEIIGKHNAQADEFKQFKIGTVSVVDPNDYITRSSTDYGTALDVLNSALFGSSLGGYLHITHEYGDTVPTIHYLADFTKQATQEIEFGENLKNYTKTVKTEELATAIIPLGTSTGSNGERLTVVDANNGMDYIYSEAGVALRGWVFKTVVWEDVTLAANLLTKARAYLESAVNQNITVELTAIDLHLLDRSIESFGVCEYIRVRSTPHKFDQVLLCNKQTLDLLKPDNDTVTLGYETASFTDRSSYMAANVTSLGNKVSSIKQEADSIKMTVEDLDKDMESRFEQFADGLSLSVSNGSTSSTIRLMLNGVQIDSENISFTGFATFTGLSGGTTTIDGACIKTGTIDAERLNLSGAITWDDLGSGVKGEINAGADAYDKVDSWSYNGGTYIDGEMIKAGTIYVGELYGGEIYLLDDDGNEAGVIFTTGASSYDGGKLAIETGAFSVEALDGDIYLGNADDMYLQLDAGGDIILGNADVRPNYDDSFTCGTSSRAWTDVYSVNDLSVTSDLTKKKEVVYGLAAYDGFFDALQPISFLFINGTSGRRHIGLGAQDVEAALEANGLTSQDFAGLIISPKQDEKGQTIEGYDYHLRYGEFTALCIEQIQALKKRVAVLEGKA